MGPARVDGQNGALLSGGGASTDVDLSVSRAACLLPLGTGRTVSTKKPAGYRYWLWRRLGSYGRAFDFVGAESAGDGATTPDFDPNHEGHPGMGLSEMLEHLEHDWLPQYATPGFVLIELGPSEALQDPVLERRRWAFREILRVLRRKNPRVIVAVAGLPEIAGNDVGDKASFSGLRADETSAPRATAMPATAGNRDAAYDDAFDTTDTTATEVLEYNKMVTSFVRLSTPKSPVLAVENIPDDQALADRFFVALQPFLDNVTPCLPKLPVN